MKMIRRNVFETNSSSTHSIAIPKTLNKGYMDNFVFEVGQYGWEHDYYDLSNYLYTAILQLSAIDGRYGVEEGEYKVDKELWKEKIKEVLSPYVNNVVFIEPNDNVDYYYVDHVSELRDLLEELDEDDEKLVNALLGGEVMTGNDNNGEYEFYDEFESDTDNYDYYFKGN